MRQRTELSSKSRRAQPTAACRPDVRADVAAASDGRSSVGLVGRLGGAGREDVVVEEEQGPPPHAPGEQEQKIALAPDVVDADGSRPQSVHPPRR